MQSIKIHRNPVQTLKLIFFICQLPLPLLCSLLPSHRIENRSQLRGYCDYVIDHIFPIAVDSSKFVLDSLCWILFPHIISVSLLIPRAPSVQTSSLCLRVFSRPPPRSSRVKYVCRCRTSRRQGIRPSGHPLQAGMERDSGGRRQFGRRPARSGSGHRRCGQLLSQGRRQSTIQIVTGRDAVERSESCQGPQGLKTTGCSLQEQVVMSNCEMRE